MQAETLLSPAFSVAGEQSVQGVIDRILRRLSKQPELASPASGSFGPAIFATDALYVQIGAGSLPTHRSPRCLIHFPRRRLGFAEFFSRRWLDHAVRTLLRCKVFRRNTTQLYLLAFLLTANHQEAQACFVGAMDKAFAERNVFKGWEESWSKRCLIEHAIGAIIFQPGRREVRRDV
jgi:hypothetical protein